MGGQPSKSSVNAADEKASLRQMPRESRAVIPSVEDETRAKTMGRGATGECNEKMVTGGTDRVPQPLSLETVASLPAKIVKDPKDRLALTVFGSANPREVLASLPAQQADPQVYNIKIPFEGGPITDQQSSGRCWLFASTNTFRVALMQKYNLDSFELSQAYLFYWDKLEKANWFLEQVIDTAGEDLEGRLVQTLMKEPVSDGGQWDMVYNLVDKYGLVPQSLYPDNWSAKNSSVLNAVVKNKLRQFGLELRRMARSSEPASAAALDASKTKMMYEMQRLMTLLLGPTPKPTDAFTWQYNDKDGKAQQLTTTPKEFAKNITSADFRITSSVVESMISLVNDPRHEPLSLLTVSRLGNVVGGRGVSYVNVDMETLKGTCVKMLKSGLPIFFGCDVGKFSNTKSGVMDTALFDYENGLGTGLLGMNKAERLLTGESQMTHAMVLTAVHLDEDTGKPKRWRVQNSWGANAGDKGWFVMSDAWMDEFVYQVVVDPRFCSREVKKVLEQEAIVLPLWDPMGSLA